MSPVSRGRRLKKGGKREQQKRSDTARLPAGLLGSPFGMLGGAGGRPGWFDAAIDRVLTGAAALTAAGDARELDQRVAELVGAQLHAALQRGGGLHFGWWFDELVEAAVERVEDDDHPEAEGVVRLLHGLAVQDGDLAPELLHRARQALPDPPDWLAGLARLRATGEVRLLRDAYGTGFGVIAEYVLLGDGGSYWYLWDVDASGLVQLADAGVHDGPEQAAATWRGSAGDPDAAMVTVEDATVLRCLVELDIGEEMTLRGDESRRVMDNWFRADARRLDLERALHARGRPLPARDSLHHDLDIAVLTEPFTAWYVHTHGSGPDREVVDALAGEWMEGALPETWFCASPARIHFLHGLISDWVDDDPVTLGVLGLLPDWVRWLGGRADLPAERIQALLNAAHQPAQRTKNPTRSVMVGRGRDG